MAIELGEKQYELGGVVFGLDCPVVVTEDGWQPGSAERIGGKQQMPSGDGVRFGKQRYGSANWPFKLFTDGEDEQAGWAALAELESAWGADDVRATTDEVVALRYRVAKQTRRVYGRPGRWTITPNNFSLYGRIDIAADFDTVDQLVYEDAPQSVEVQIAPPLDRNAGLVVPFVVPATTTPRSGPRSGELNVGGTVPTPAIVTFSGPCTGAEVVVSGTTLAGEPWDGWTCRLTDAVADEDDVVVDARPWSRSATRKNGGGVRINPRVTQISAMYLPPGHHELVFTGTDPSGTATVTLEWLNAHRSPR